MFETDTTADRTVSRRSVLKMTTGVVAGSTALAGLGTGAVAAETEEGLRLRVLELTEEYIAVAVALDDPIEDEERFPTDVFLGHAERFVLHEDEDAVSLPEETDGLARPAEVDFENPHEIRMYFRTGGVDLSETDGEEVVLGLGVFPERTVPRRRWDESTFGRIHQNQPVFVLFVWNKPQDQIAHVFTCWTHIRI